MLRARQYLLAALALLSYNASVLAQTDRTIAGVKPEWLAADCVRMDMTAGDYARCVEVKGATLEPLDLQRREQFGEIYDPKKYVVCRKENHPADTRCKPLALRRQEQREYWPHPELPKPQLPNAPNPPIYKAGMTSKQYFDALCRAEAGEFIFKSVENVEGIYQIRPRAHADDYTLRDRFVMEDPYGYSESEARRPFARFVGAKQYRFFESPVSAAPRFPVDKNSHDDSFFQAPPPDARVARYTYIEENKSGRLWGHTRRDFDKAVRSRYGYTWREIRRPKDRDLGVVVGELVVVDLLTNEVLGIRRGFAYSGYVRNTRSGFQWEIAHVCPSKPNWTGGDLAPPFVLKVLRPANAGSGARHHILIDGRMHAARQQERHFSFGGRIEA